MNKPAIRIEEQIISCFSQGKTQVCQGWILKEVEKILMVYPLYYQCFEENVLDRVRSCEEIGRHSGRDCVFRLVEHTNYHLSAVLADSGYVLQKCGVVGQLWLSKPDVLVGSGGQESSPTLPTGRTLILTEGAHSESVELEELLEVSRVRGVTQILVDIPKEELPKQYEKAGFIRAYGYRCYQKENYLEGDK